MLGKLYDSGKAATGWWGKPKIAFNWFKLAADQGDKEGQFRVCKAYYRGHGVTRNMSEAKNGVQDLLDRDTLELKISYEKLMIFK